jgi:uncharacterized membrane protein
LVTVLQILHGRHLISISTAVFRVLVWGINHQDWVLPSLLLVGVGLVVGPWRNKIAVAADMPATDAAKRLELAQIRRRRRFTRLTLCGTALTAAVVTVVAAWDARMPELSPAEPLTIDELRAVIQLDQIDDGHLHRFAYTTHSGETVRFIVIKKNGVAYGVGLDACEICGDTGYIERDGKIICRLCDVIMNIATIGFKGGCNPIPLDFELVDGTLQVDLVDLEAAAPIFA